MNSILAALSAASTGDPSDSLASLDRAIAANPREPLPYVGRGLSRHDVGDAVGALADFGRFLDLSPLGTLADRVRTMIARLRELHPAAFAEAA